MHKKKLEKEPITINVPVMMGILMMELMRIVEFVKTSVQNAKLLLIIVLVKQY